MNYLLLKNLKNTILTKNINLNLIRNIHNQSYIVLNKEYNYVLSNVESLNKKINKLNQELLKKNEENLKLNKKIKELKKELSEKNKFYNLHVNLIRN